MSGVIFAGVPGIMIGHNGSPWYHEQIDDWVNGTYHVTSLGKVKGSTLRLRTKQVVAKQGGGRYSPAYRSNTRSTALPYVSPNKFRCTNK
ncbi:penicillin acylase II [Geobacillus genomosp. 3]|uniref:Penicillin acylase II n=1 Tax=Geobacillus genomosp. 3 TaxID=1921421 RepID=V5LX08_GEOG3|nr:penicillin acylase II [Geobacillus genomosp. 3]